MDGIEQIKKYQEFFENYVQDIMEQVNKENNFFVVDFSEISIFSPDLAEELLENPEDSIKAAELSIQNFDIPSEKFYVRFKNLPKSQKIMIRDIRSRHIGKLLFLEGIVRQKTDVRPQVTTASFECPSCGNVINVIQLDTRFKEPSRCGCGRKGKFRLMNKELIDVQGMVLEEAPEDLEGGEQPKRMNVFLKNDLVSPITDKKTNPGSKIKAVGFIKEVPIISRTGSQSTRFDLIIEANFVEPADEDYYELKISDEEEKEILELSKDPELYKKLVASIAPSIYGYSKIKEALLLQLLGGVQKTRSDGVITRGDMHVLLVGDPGAAKSQMLKRMTLVAPKARYVSGKGVSGAGLTATVVRDEFLRGWALEAGALVLASNGMCMIDELDKMSPEDRGAMHEALEQQTVSISKANIQATLIARTTVLAAANPKFGRFDPYDIIAKQIDLPPTLINRFDLIFAIKDIPNREKDEKMATHILNLHKNPELHEPVIATQKLKKYIAYARRNINPELTEEALEEIKKYYIEMRSINYSEGEALSAIPISPRQLEALVRLSEASARVKLSKEVTRDDAKRAVKLLHYSLSEIGMDPETGKIDIDIISTGISATERSKITSVKEIINELENTIGRTIPIDDILREASERGLPDEKVEEAIEKLKRTGDLFEPRKGFIQKL